MDARNPPPVAVAPVAAQARPAATGGYRGPLRGVIFDWAGTVIDFGSRAPVTALEQLFAAHGLPLSEEEARGPMGRHKRDHIRDLLALPHLAEAWERQTGTPWSEADVEGLYGELLPLTLDAARAHTGLIPGVLECARALRERGLAIGSTTGYNAEMMAELAPLAAQQGYRPDAVVTVSDVPAGRPAPWMCFRNAERLGIYPMAALIKVGDTPADIAEGLAAGMWTVGLSRCGNEVGLSEAALAALPAGERQQRIARATDRLRAAGAHYVVEGPGDLVTLLPAIECRLVAGERP